MSASANDHKLALAGSRVSACFAPGRRALGTTHAAGITGLPRRPRYPTPLFRRVHMHLSGVLVPDV